MSSGPSKASRCIAHLYITVRFRQISPKHFERVALVHSLSVAQSSLRKDIAVLFR